MSIAEEEITAVGKAKLRQLGARGKYPNPFFLADDTIIGTEYTSILTDKLEANLNTHITRFVKQALKTHPDGILTRKDATKLASSNGLPFPDWFVKPTNQVQAGRYKLPFNHPILDQPFTVLIPALDQEDVLQEKAKKVKYIAPVKAIPTNDLSHCSELPKPTIPKVDPLFVPYGYYEDLKTILQSNTFVPCYIFGETGIGKSLTVRQIAAQLNRSITRAQIVPTTDESDLLGGFRLRNGTTVFELGPIAVAMIQGSICLIDEIDLGSPRLLCLQAVLEGEPVLIKAINQVIEPAPGFTVVSTANTIGKGNDSGRFTGTQVMNSAMLDRHIASFVAEYPPESIEVEILTRKMQSVATTVDNEFIARLIKWGRATRETQHRGTFPDAMTPRALVGAVSLWAIFGGDEKKAVNLVTEKLPVSVRTAFRELYTKV